MCSLIPRLDECGFCKLDFHAFTVNFFSHQERGKPMKILLLLTLLMLTPVLQAQFDVQRDPRLVVLKFSWAKERQISALNQVVPDSGPSTNEPMPINQARDSQGDVRNKRDLATRRAELDDNERNMTDASQKRSNSYPYPP